MKFLAFFAKKVMLGAALLAVTAASFAALRAAFQLAIAKMDGRRFDMMPILIAAKSALLTALVGALALAAGVMTLLFFFFATYGGRWEQRDIADIYICLLNLSTGLLTIPAALGAFNPGCLLNFKEFWPTGALLAVAGTTLLITAAIVVMPDHPLTLTVIDDYYVLQFLMLSNTITLLAAALCTAQFPVPKYNMRQYGVVRVAYIAAVAHAAGIALFLGPAIDALASTTYGPASYKVWSLMAILWPELGAALLIPAALSWRGMPLPYTLLGLAAAVAVNVAAYFYVRNFYGTEPQTGDLFHAGLSTAIPLLLFLVILARRGWRYWRRRA